MIEEQARIVAIDDNRVWLEVRRPSTCSGCAVRSGCGHGILDAMSSRRPAHLQLPRPASLGDTADAGHTVVLGLPEQALLAASVRIYLLPLVGLVAGALLGSWLAGGGDPGAIGGAIAGVLLACLVAGRLERHRVTLQPAIRPRPDADP